MNLEGLKKQIAERHDALEAKTDAILAHVTSWRFSFLGIALGLLAGLYAWHVITH